MKNNLFCNLLWFNMHIHGIRNRRKDKLLVFFHSLYKCSFIQLKRVCDNEIHPIQRRVLSILLTRT